LSPAKRSGAVKGTLVFSHANGFPGGTYRVLFEAWRNAGFDVIAPEKLGHDPAHAVTSNWPRVRDELVAYIEAHATEKPAHLVGHSLGGYLSLLVASRRPELARSVVLLDSPVVTGWRAHSIRVAKATGLMKRVSPGKISHRRRWQWSSVDDAYKHFAAKSTFARWDPRMLRDYVTTGTELDPATGGVRLAFDRGIETRLYNTLPHNMGALLARHPVKCPVSFVGGTQSTEVRQVGMAATRALTHGRIEWVAGTHLFPMEKPALAAAAVLQAIG
jgi:pimeloyl-ACP methyl ester carboxylesterase